MSDALVKTGCHLFWVSPLLGMLGDQRTVPFPPCGSLCPGSIIRASHSTDAITRTGFYWSLLAQGTCSGPGPLRRLQSTIPAPRKLVPVSPAAQLGSLSVAAAKQVFLSFREARLSAISLHSDRFWCPALKAMIPPPRFCQA